MYKNIEFLGLVVFFFQYRYLSGGIGVRKMLEMAGYNDIEGPPMGVSV